MQISEDIKLLLEYITKNDYENYAKNRHNVPIHKRGMLPNFLGPHVELDLHPNGDPKGKVIIPNPSEDNTLAPMPGFIKKYIHKKLKTNLGKLGIDPSYSDTGNLTGPGSEFIKNHELAHHQLDHTTLKQKYQKAISAEVMSKDKFFNKISKINKSLQNQKYQTLKTEAEADKLAGKTMGIEKGLKDHDLNKHTSDAIKSHLRNSGYANQYYTLGKKLGYYTGRGIYKSTHSNNKVLRAIGKVAKGIKSSIKGK